MNRSIGLADAPLATKLAALRPELAALQTEVGTSLPAGAVAEVQQVKNDVRLPSHSLLEAVLPAKVPAGAPRAADAPPSVATQWSAAARAISAVLADLHADAEPVRGAAPLWPSAQAPAAPVLAGALAQTVAGSGMFYESHLAEFAKGLRTVRQLAEEPQMRLTQAATPTSAGTAQPSFQVPAQPQPAQVVPGRPVAADQLLAVPSAGQPVAAAGASAPAASQPVPGAPAHGQPVAVAQGAPAQTPPASVYTSQGVPVASAAVPAFPGDAGVVSDERTASRGLGENSAAASSARPAASVAAPAEMIHPQTVALVHQQLDLLATSVFRWSGQAWPNVPMEWSIHEEADQPADAPGDRRNEERKERPRSWSTTVSLSLPRLGAVDLRLSLTGELVQARLAASETATLARLRNDSGGLGPRLEAAGLRLQDLQITAMSPVEHAE
ncbi:flagellar hook-length control protein FliK [Variovorax sp. DXTD-1]|uniref:flagellar hook-length control protein FliK n=1 Tax=Variovorax sp. DXTD-1 TaxID=2495592 RepID=UPI000F87067A|nr:flagellar hook-length control protein FliK [Variovorax sp. DXTD-1]RST49023.1 flagellar hook-length control protein FliK [Variovorax sp. DXTD-1]